MRRYVFLIFILTLTNLTFSQPWRMEERQLKRIEEYKKVKLIESLDLSEEESVKFFSIYNEHQKKVRSLQKERNDVIDQISKMTKDESRFSEKRFFELENRLTEIDQELFKNRKEFYNNVRNAISSYKFAKFIVFEREFYRDLNNLIMRRRMQRE